MTRTIAGATIAGTRPYPERGQFLAAAVLDDDSAFDTSARHDAVPGNVYSRYPSLALTRFDTITTDVDTAVDDTIAELDDRWDNGDAIAIWSAPIALGVLAAARPDFTVRGSVLDMQLLDRYLFPHRSGKRSAYTLAEHLGIPAPGTATLANEADMCRLAADAMVQRYPELQLDDDTLMRLQRGWAQLNSQSLRAWLTKQHRDRRTVDARWPLWDDRATPSMT